MPPAPQNSGRNATVVAVAIFLSRVMGLVRQRLYAHFLGTGPAATALGAALRIPNFMQNLLGEGALSASFIPVYASLRAKGDDAAAERLAGGIFGLLSAAVGVLTTLGVLLTDPLVGLLAPGLSAETHALAVTLTRLLFPGVGLLVMSAWCLGVLNSHRRFFLSYAAPVVWNLCIIGALVAVGPGSEPSHLVTVSAAATSVGGLAQLLVQWPGVRAVLPRLPLSLGRGDANVGQVLKGFVPAVLSRGVVQVSASLDTVYASLVSEHALALITNVQPIALLPVSLFGIAVSAAELPELSADAAKGLEERHQAIAQRLEAGLARLAFFVVPSALAFIALGDALSGLLLEGGRFTAHDSRLAWYFLAAIGVGLFSATSGRLYASAFWALRDTRTPLRAAVVRLVVGAGLGFFAARVAITHFGLPVELGAAALALASSGCALVETRLLRIALRGALGRDVHVPKGVLPKVLVAGLAAVAGAIGLKLAALRQFGAAPEAVAAWGGEWLPSPALRPWLFSPAQILVFGAIYGLMAVWLDVGPARALLKKVTGRLRRNRLNG